CSLNLPMLHSGFRGSASVEIIRGFRGGIPLTLFLSGGRRSHRPPHPSFFLASASWVSDLAREISGWDAIVVRDQAMTAERQKIRAAEWLYRWSLSSGIIGIVFTILSFMGVFTLILGPIFTERFGFTFLQTASVLFL